MSKYLYDFHEVTVKKIYSLVETLNFVNTQTTYFVLVNIIKHNVLMLYLQIQFIEFD